MPPRVTRLTCADARVVGWLTPTRPVRHTATQFPREAHRERLGWWAGPSRPTSLIVITTPEDTVHIQTAAVQTLRDHEHGAVVPPVHLASTYELDPRTDDGLYAYQRGGNPTRAQLERGLAELDGTPHGLALATRTAPTGAAPSPPPDSREGSTPPR